MPSTPKPAIDKVLNYIDNLPVWSKNICLRLRDIILKSDASIVEEWKWGPNYGSNGMICGYGAFQKHIKLTFFNGSAMKDPQKLFNHCVDNEFSRSIKITSETELDERVLTEYIRESVAVNKGGFKRVIKDKTIIIPEELEDALSKNKKAAGFFHGLTYGYKKEFAEHVTTAKLEKTKLERIAKIIALCEVNKTLHHKYK